MPVPCLFFSAGLNPKKQFFCEYLAEYTLLWKNTRVENCFLENFLSNQVFKTQRRPHTQPTKLF